MRVVNTLEMEKWWSLPAAEPHRPCPETAERCVVVTCGRRDCDGDCLIPASWDDTCLFAVHGWANITRQTFTNSQIREITAAVWALRFRLAGMDAVELRELINDTSGLDVEDTDLLLGWLGWR